MGRISGLRRNIAMLPQTPPSPAAGSQKRNDGNRAFAKRIREEKKSVSRFPTDET